MQVSCSLRNAKISPQKARLVADQIRGLSIDQALNILNFSVKKGALLLKKVVASAVANAEHNRYSFCRWGPNVQAYACTCKGSWYSNYKADCPHYRGSL